MKVFTNCVILKNQNFNINKAKTCNAQKTLNKKFLKFPNKTFFLKYMIKKGLIPDPKEKIPKQAESVDIKSLLDEKNVKISLRDIWTDYKYFKNDYYYVKVEPDKNAPLLPFDSKTISFKAVFEYLFIKGNFSFAFIMAQIFILLYFFTFIIQWRMKRLEVLNENILKGIDKTEEDKFEKIKHGNKKWTNYE